MKEVSTKMKKIKSLEDEIAKEMFDCKFEDLDEDDKELVTYEMYDRLGDR